VVHDRGKPFTIRSGVLRNGEAADRSLGAVLVAVEQVDQQELMTGERSFDTRPVGIVARPYGCLPKAQVVRGRVEIAGLGRNVAGSGRTICGWASISSGEALGLMSCPASTLHPSMTAIPVPTFCSDIAM
jgi:hypothetical protein